MAKANRTKPAPSETSARSKAKPTVSKKNPNGTATANPKPDPAPVVPLSEYEKLQKELEQVQKDLDNSKAQKVSIKTELSRLKERAIAAEQKLKDVEHKIDNTVTDTRGWINRGNKWVFAAVPILILGVWLFFVYQQRNSKDVIIARKDAAINSLQTDLQTCKQGNRYDSIHNTNNAIPTPDTEGEKKNSIRKIK
jgi:tetrahydromethanopterin S-methyltransferase subunit G